MMFSQSSAGCSPQAEMVGERAQAAAKLLLPAVACTDLEHDYSRPSTTKLFSAELDITIVRNFSKRRMKI